MSSMNFSHFKYFHCTLFHLVSKDILGVGPQCKDMKASSDITMIELAEEFRICPQCGYELGFHSSFLRSGEGYRIILICPECGARYDVGWQK
jgi:hypothetical protein